MVEKILRGTDEAGDGVGKEVEVADGLGGTDIGVGTTSG